MKSSARIRSAAACAMLRFCPTASASLAAIVGSSAKNWPSGRVAPPWTLFKRPCRASSVRSRRIVDSLALSASHSSCTVAVRFSASRFRIRAKRSSANIGVCSFPGLCLTDFGVLWMFLIDCGFIIADYLSNSISFGHFHSPKTKGGFCAGCTKQKRLPPRGKLSPKVTDEGRVCAATLLRAITASSPLIRPTATFPQGGRHDTFQINFPVLLSGFRFTSAGVPQATTRPPSSPPPGPMSMR